MFLIELILITCSITWVFTLSKSMKPFREWISKKRMSVLTGSLTPNVFVLAFWTFLEMLLDCYGCFGFWASIPAYYLLVWDFHRDIFAYMFVGSFSSIILLTWYMKYLEKK